MRLKKHKKNRKAVRFYSTCYGFREPFKVLCDGTFVHHLLSHRLGTPDTVLSSLLSARVIPFSTSCILSELRRLGDSFSDTLCAARSFALAKCEHGKGASAAKCIDAIIKDNNPDHFFVASQDAELRKKFKEIPGVPVIFAVKNSLFVDQPSARDLQFMRKAEEERLHMKEQEIVMIEKREKKKHADQAAGDGTEASGEQHGEGQRTWQDIVKKFNAKDTTKFKRKRAKGPNPLSCKKKKSAKGSTAA